jgi:hypothetical protein
VEGWTDSLSCIPTKSASERNSILENASNVFGSAAAQADAVDLVPLHTKIGQQALELDILNNALNKAGSLSAKQ